jgi:hypothetical protein
VAATDWIYFAGAAGTGVTLAFEGYNTAALSGAGDAGALLQMNGNNNLRLKNFTKAGSGQQGGGGDLILGGGGHETLDLRPDSSGSIHVGSLDSIDAMDWNAAGNFTFNLPVYGPTAPAGTANTQLASTAFVHSEGTTIANSAGTAAAQTVVNQAMATGVPGGNYVAANNGYATIPGGAIIRWGQNTINSLNPIQITFSPPFPHAIACVQVSMTSDASGQDAIVRVSKNNPINTAGFVINYDAFGGTFDFPLTVYWMAIGY